MWARVSCGCGGRHLLQSLTVSRLWHTKLLATSTELGFLTRPLLMFQNHSPAIVCKTRKIVVYMYRSPSSATYDFEVTSAGATPCGSRKP